MRKVYHIFYWCFLPLAAPWARAVPKALGQKGFKGRPVEGQPEDRVYSLLLKIYSL